MTFVVGLEGFTPPRRYNGTPWTQARIEQAPTPDAGAAFALETQALSPLDPDPVNPAERNFTTSLATEETAWFRIVWVDAAAGEFTSGWVFSSPATYRVNGETVQELLEDMDVLGIDADDAAKLRWFNARHRQMVAESRWLKMPLSLGMTVAESSSYALNPDVVEVYELTVGGYGYSRARRQDMIAGRQNRLRLSGTGGVFIGDADVAGNPQVTLYPPPGAGQEIQAFVAMLPANLTMLDRPVVPADFFGGLVDGVSATALALDPEQLGAADRFEARFASETERLRREARRRFRGPGPAQIRVQGWNG